MATTPKRTIRIDTLPVKFFPKDVIGKQPKKVGDKFVAFFMVGNIEFTVTEFGDGVFFGVAGSGSGK